MITAICVSCFGQANQKNAVYLVEHSLNYHVDKVSFISDFAKNRYINQPSFIDDRRILLSADDDGDGLTDIIEVNLNDKSFYKVTNTKTISEFSPKLDLTKNNICCIIQNGNVQTLHMYPRTRESAGKRVADLKQPGYFEWITNDELVYFAVNTPNKLLLHNIKTGVEAEIDQKPGRAFYKIFDQLFYSTGENGIYRLKSYDLRTKTTTNLEEMPGQDFIVDEMMNFYSTKGSTILKRNNNKGTWETIIDLKNQQINNLSRISKKGSKFVVVNTM